MSSTTYTHAKAVALIDYQPAFMEGTGKVTWNRGLVTTEKSTNRLTEQIFGLAGMGLPRQKGQLATYFTDSMGELDPTTFTMVKYGIKSMFSYELLKYDHHIGDLMGKAGREMGENFAYLKDLVVSQVLNRATTSGYTLFDGAVLAATHTMRSGDTLTNLLSAMSISYDNVYTGINYFYSTLINQAGLRVIDEPAYIITHPTNRKTLDKVLSATGEPDTMDLNNPNGLAQYNLKAVYNPHLTSTTAWMITSKKFKDDFIVWNVESPTYDMEDDKELDGSIIRGKTIFGVGLTDFKHIAYSAGA